jgi:hypothetical protein
MSWDDFRRDTPDGPSTTKVVVWAVIAALFVIVLPLALWLTGVFASPAIGKANAYRDKHGATNWTQAQAQFEQDYASVIKFDKQVTAAQDDLDQWVKDNPKWTESGPYDPVREDHTNLVTDLKGARQQCQNTVADYNARARTYTLRDFKSADLPQQIDDTDPATDCAPTAH